MLKKTTGRAPSQGKRLIKALILAIGWTLAASMVVAWMINIEILRLEQTGYASMIILLVCGLLLARRSDPGGKTEWMISTAIGVAAYYFGLVLVNLLFFGGEFVGFGVTLVVLLTGAVLGSITHRKGRGGHTRRRYKIPRN